MTCINNADRVGIVKRKKEGKALQWKLIIARKELNLNQEDMGKVLKIQKDTYGRKERGDLQFTQDEIFLLSEYFDKQVDEIFLPRNSINNAQQRKKCINDESGSGDKRAAT